MSWFYFESVVVTCQLSLYSYTSSFRKTQESYLALHYIGSVLCGEDRLKWIFHSPKGGHIMILILRHVEGAVN